MEANDIKAMREALEAILKEANTQYRNDNGIDLEWLMTKAKTALAAQPRNCDVGTPEEQNKRFYHMFCRAGIDGCIKCRLDGLPHRGNTCGIYWAQMPYEEEGTKPKQR